MQHIEFQRAFGADDTTPPPPADPNAKPGPTLTQLSWWIVGGAALVGALLWLQPKR